METAKPKILLVSATQVFGGGEVYYVKLTKLLLDRYKLGAVVFNAMLHKELEAMGVRVWRGEMLPTLHPLGKYLLVAKYMRKALKEFSPALVHLNGGPEGYLGFLPRLYKVPVLITNHILRRIAPSELPKRVALAVSTRCAETTVCVSATVQRNLRKHAWTDNNVVIPNWIEKVPELQFRPPYDGKRPFRLLFVGRLEAAKGIYDLIHAMGCLRNVSLDVVGEGAEMASAMEASCGLPVHFHGFTNDLTSFYRNADLLIFPSHFEGQGLVLLEAMSHGLPCLVSDIEAVLETTGNGKFAAVFRCGDICDLADKINALQRDGPQLADLSQSARAYALKTYSEEHVGQAYVRFFQSALRVGTA